MHEGVYEQRCPELSCPLGDSDSGCNHFPELLLLVGGKVLLPKLLFQELM